MASHLWDWVNLLVRVFHLIAGIAWIGSSFYFMWLDATVARISPDKKDVEGELWMVHGGGFYLVEKRYMTAATMPKELHWFKWEATLTWISGILMLGLVYYLHGGAMLLPPDSNLTPAVAVAISLGVIGAAWLVYDTLWASKLADIADGKIALAISFGLMFIAGWLLTTFFTGRAAFIHIGAMLGTLMVANVWVRILPSQQKMIDATARGETPDYSLGKKGKRRSVHNSYMTFPVLVLMLSGHYPALYSGNHGWLVLALIFFAGAGIRHVMIARLRKSNADWVLVPAIAALAALVWITGPSPRTGASATSPMLYQDSLKSDDAAILAIAQRRCVSCHAESPQDNFYTVAPAGLKLESIEVLRRMAPVIKARAVDTETMPPANKTGMTIEERQALANWISKLGESQSSGQP